ncbi:MAG: exodeoxyribonuclease VII small subunit [Clostridia bacterium]|jgi:exodeoxyribonuclease VII small subunit|nr:exodeoxyribonuclease VII small subunit [Clostridia bacterium]
MSGKIDFEKSLSRLEEITSVLEKGEISLDEMIDLYTEGTKLVALCNEKLENAQVKISELTRESTEKND